MPRDVSQAEIGWRVNEIKTERTPWITAIRMVFGDRWTPPKDTSDVDRRLKEIESRQGTTDSETLVEAAREVHFQEGEIGVIDEFFGGVGAEVNVLIQTTSGRGKEGEKVMEYKVGGEVFTDRENAERTAKAAVLKRRVEAVDETIEQLAKKSGHDLTDQDRGRFYAAVLIDQGGYDLARTLEMGVVEAITKPLEVLESRQADLTGLDSTDANKALSAQAKKLPAPAVFKDLAEDPAVASGIDRRPFDPIGGKIGILVEDVVHRLTNEYADSGALAREGVDLEKEVQARINESTWQCAQHQVRIYELSEEDRTGGLSALTAEMHRRKVDEDLLYGPYRRQGLELALRAVKDLDGVYRAIFEHQFGEGVPGVYIGGQFFAGVDPDRAKVIVRLLEDRKFKDIASPKAKKRLLRGISDPQERERIEDMQPQELVSRFLSGINEPQVDRERLRKARALFGIDPVGRRDDNKFLRVAGYLDYVSWSQTRAGEYKDEATGEKISWVTGDPIVLGRFRDPTHEWWVNYVLGAVKEHLQEGEKVLGFNADEVTEAVLAADLVEREGIDLKRFAELVRQDPARVNAIASQLARGMRPNLRIEVMMALENLAPLLKADGKLDPVVVMERLQARPWGEKASWEQLADAESKLFKHLRGNLKTKTMNLFYEMGYEHLFREYVNTVIGRGKAKDIPAEIDMRVSKQKFLRTRTMVEMGLDFNASLVDSIREFLANSQWKKAYGREKLDPYISSVVIGGRSKSVLTGLPEEVRLEILAKLGIDIDQPLPDQGYNAWRLNLDNLIANAGQLRYPQEVNKQEVIKALQAFDGTWKLNEDSIRPEDRPKDVVLDFKWRLARAAYKRYLGLGQTMLERRRGLNIDQLWESVLQIENDGLLSREEDASKFVGEWGGDILGKRLERELNPWFLVKLVKRPGLVLKQAMVGFFDFIHGRSIQETKELGFWGRMVPDSGPTLTAFLVNTGINAVVSLLSHSVMRTPVFYAYPFLDRVLPFLRPFSAIPLHLGLDTAALLGLQLIVLRLPILGPLKYLSGFEAQGWVVKKMLEGVDSILKRRGGMGILSQKEIIEARTPKEKRR